MLWIKELRRVKIKLVIILVVLIERKEDGHT